MRDLWYDKSSISRGLLDPALLLSLELQEAVQRLQMQYPTFIFSSCRHTDKLAIYMYFFLIRACSHRSQAQHH